ncbi:MAG TPA: ABC transporter substrate-binding protein [Dehalococcoidia bacterium]|nr:ABC transporter substrate-binding protein [Dehalococcoidia bacterium]
MAGSYWQRVTLERLRRRRLLTGAGAAAASVLALSLAGCGGGGEDDKEDGSSLVYRPQDSTSDVKRGGTLKGFDSSDPPSMDPLTSSAFQTTSTVAYWAYPRLLKWQTAKYPEAAAGATEGELAESYEISADKLQVTFKLRQGMKWDPRAPTNNRLIDAQDVIFSWERFTKLNSLASAFSSVASLTAPDARTIVVKLKFADASIIQLFTAATLFFVLPREADGGFDPRNEVRGHGPWMLTELRPSVMRVWSRNSDYYVKGRPYFDKWELPIVPEYATRLAQLKAGNIWSIDTGGTGAAGVRQEDIIVTKRDVSKLRLVYSEGFQVTPSFLSFGYEGDSPFKDERMRQALAMLVDREALTDVISNRDKFRAEGLEIPVRYHSVVGAGWDGYWIDPQDDKEFGPNAKYLKYNQAEAKKLMDAAGYKNGVDTTFYYSLGAQYGAEYVKLTEIFPGMFSQAGVRSKPDGKDYNTDWLPNIYWGYLSKEFTEGKKKGFNGFMYGLERGYPTVATQLAATLHKDGERFHGLTPDGKSAHLGDAKLNDMIDKVKAEFDLKKQQGMVQEVSRYVAQKAYNVPATYARLSFDLVWPVLGNYGVFRTYNSGSSISESRLNWWIDNTKPPLAAG